MRVTFDKEVQDIPEDGWVLCFQHVSYQENTEEPLSGYRFIWRRPEGSLHERAAR